jgi:hypothetical protein
MARVAKSLSKLNFGSDLIFIMADQKTTALSIEDQVEQLMALPCADAMPKIRQLVRMLRPAANEYTPLFLVKPKSEVD